MANTQKMSFHIPALVVGLCSHGLSICRSLGGKGVPVYALESDKKLPGLKTRYARKRLISDINGPGLIRDLVKIRKEFKTNPVLFLTNDNMVRTIAESYDEIEGLFCLNLPPQDLILDLLDKKNLTRFTQSNSLRYPRTFTISRSQDLNQLKDLLRYPIALKPSTPLSPFKALRINNENELRGQIEHYQDSVKLFLLQDWISGTERNIFFTNFYFDKNHKSIAKFVGSKIRAFPRNTGGACSAEPCYRDDLLEIGLEFFEKLPIRGPVSLEIKEDEDGYRYVIEPTVGRFDYYILCCIRNGVDMPYISYKYQIDNTVVNTNENRRHTIWVDFEKDFPVYLESFQNKGERKEAILFLFKRKVFALWAWNDMKPSLYTWPKSLKKYFQKSMSIFKKIFRRQKGVFAWSTLFITFSNLLLSKILRKKLWYRDKNDFLIKR